MATHESVHDPPIVEFRPLMAFDCEGFQGQYGFDRTALIDGEAFLEVEPELSRERARCDVMRAAEG